MGCIVQPFAPLLENLTMTVTVTIDAETARICLPAVKQALTDATFRANAARNDAAFHREENRACALDCLIAALERALPPKTTCEHSELAIARAILGAP